MRTVREILEDVNLSEADATQQLLDIYMDEHSSATKGNLLKPSYYKGISEQDFYYFVYCYVTTDDEERKRIALFDLFRFLKTKKKQDEAKKALHQVRQFVIDRFIVYRGRFISYDSACVEAIKSPDLRQKAEFFESLVAKLTEIKMVYTEHTPIFKPNFGSVAEMFTIALSAENPEDTLRELFDEFCRNLDQYCREVEAYRRKVNPNYPGYHNFAADPAWRRDTFAALLEILNYLRN